MSEENTYGVSEIVGSSKTSTDDAIRKATDALAVAAGRDRREFIVTDRTNPGLTHRARHSTIDLALTEFLMGREKPPAPNSIIIRAAD